jgi:hypothetical protein
VQHHTLTFDSLALACSAQSPLLETENRTLGELKSLAIALHQQARHIGTWPPGGTDAAQELRAIADRLHLLTEIVERCMRQGGGTRSIPGPVA